MWTYLETVLLVIASVHLIKAPFTKVEESFSIQAIHDILNYGVFDISQYDHLKFPGVVPRSFIGPLVIAYLSKPFVLFSKLWSGNNSPPTQFETQLLARCMIALTNCLAVIYLKNAVQELFNRETSVTVDENGEPKQNEKDNSFTSVGNWFLIFFMSSFHLMFYCSRPLPNFIMAFPLSNIALAFVLHERYNLAIALLAFVAIVFRIEVGALGVGVTLFSLYFKKITLNKAIRFGLMGVSLGMGLSLFIDSYFWENYGVPEIEAFIFNVIGGHASEWGTESPFAYFNKYLPMLFLPPTALILNYYSMEFAPESLKIVAFAGYLHVAILSIQPHKEWRFIVYAVPSIMLLGSVAASYLWENFKVQSVKNVLLLILLPLSPLISFILSMLFLFISRMNYPGGDALMQFNQYIMDNNVTNASVHISVPPCMTGVTLFGELDYDKFGITYDKTENYTALQELWPSYDYAITVAPNPENLPFKSDKKNQWELVGTTNMFMGLNYTYVNDLLFAEDRNLPELIRATVTNNTIIPFINDIFENAIVKEDIFYTYKRINNKK